MAKGNININYLMSTTASFFHGDAAFERYIIGPVGGGKTVALCAEILKLAMEQQADADELVYPRKDGMAIRPTRYLLVRQTYPQLKCFDPETEILTEKRGWVRFPDLQSEDRVAQRLPDGSMEYVTPLAYLEKRHTGELIGFENEGVDFLVTPEHRLVTSKLRTRKKVWDAEYQLREAKDLYGTSMYRVPRTAVWRGTETAAHSVAFYKWLGFYAAEGYADDGRGRLTAGVTQCGDDTAFVDDMFNAAGIPFRRSGKFWRIPVTVETRPLLETLVGMGRSWEKRVPDHLLRASPEQARAFLEGFALGDGHEASGCTRLYTSSAALAGQLQQLALHAGTTATVKSRDRRGREGVVDGTAYTVNHVEFIVTLCTEKVHAPRLYVNRAQENKSIGWYKVPYDGPVYCVSVPSEQVYVRRNGKAHWSGNSTLIKTFNEWTGKLGVIVYDSPIRFNAEFPMGDGTMVQLEVLFMALDNGRGAENLRSLEVTGIGFSEFAEIGEDVVSMARTRVGRFPKTVKDPVSGEIKFGPTRPCIIGESNPPSARSHWYRLFEVERPPNTRVFKQPPAMIYLHETEEYVPNPEAENINNLPGGFNYYINIINGASPEFINVYVMNNYGTTFSGKPVYPMFSPRHHVLGDPRDSVERLDTTYVPERKMVVIGLDLGLNPAAAIGQENALGGITMYDEVPGEDIRFEDFLNDMLIPTLNARFKGAPVLIVYDPANPRSSLGKHTAAQMLKLRGLAAIPAPTNDVPFRIEAVTHFLQRRDMFKLHPRCVMTREALAGAYHFEEIRGRNGVFKDEPTKNEYSHIANAVEYMCSHFYYQRRKDMTRTRLNAVAGAAKPKGGFTYV